MKTKLCSTQSLFMTWLVWVHRKCTLHHLTFKWPCFSFRLKYTGHFLCSCCRNSAVIFEIKFYGPSVRPKHKWLQPIQNSSPARHQRTIYKAILFVFLLLSFQTSFTSLYKSEVQLFCCWDIKHDKLSGHTNI